MKMPLDPQDAVKAARANGEPQLAEWLQNEADAVTKARRIARVKVAGSVLAFWLIAAALVAWAVL